ncbi:nuclear egress membrane protein [Leporid alphaherpesvirus 4]|uniref:Nuclear egress membrane protein n=1 Tax=Leporid alphaherpesvirus 4 TaxID=481315 RepID=J9QVD2_9ALPH|nr:nuclear egress membrane protein [Leporid alphaherpesvirus 4]AFR32475.1 nuclear egress membrane protein [Leporid alphaherpesvirus 4]
MSRRAGLAYGGRRSDSFEALMQRIRMVVPSMRQSWECDSGCHTPDNIPSRCVFQFSGQNGSDESFPIEYVLRLMSDWAEVPCDPYLSVQNTGVSVLFQGFFCRPAGFPRASIAVDQNNVILHATGSAGMALSALDELKRRAGLDTSPMMASMWISCFVRMPRVQLAFRFMGPEDAARTRRLLCRAAEHALEQQHRQRRSRHVPAEPARDPAAGAPAADPRSALRALRLPASWPAPPWAICAGALALLAVLFAAACARA